MDPIAVAFFFILIALCYAYALRHKNYWKNLKIPYVSPLPVFGNLKPMLLMKKGPGSFLGDIYNAPEGCGKPLLGFFIFNCEPALLVRDPELVKKILIEDFSNFRNRNVECVESYDPLGAKNLFVLRDNRWKTMRTRLSPTFTSGKMKQMFLTIQHVAAELLKTIDESILNCHPGESGVTFEIKELIAKYTTDVISICAYNIRSNALSDPNSQFRQFGRETFQSSFTRAIELWSFFFMHWISRAFRCVFFRKESNDFFKGAFREAITERQNSGVSGSDLIELLLRMRKEAEERKEGREEEYRDFDENGLIAQASVFFTAGFETTATTIMYTLYELALQQNIQDRLRKEILQALKACNGTFDYETLSQMNYLEMVVSETLRKYPPLPFLDRRCLNDYKVPNSDLVIARGTPIFISLYNGLHYDPNYFPDPEKYDPERFNEIRKGDIKPGSYLPFGGGPRICIGMRFGLMSSKLALAIFLSKYKVEPCEETCIPVQLSPKTLLLSPVGGMYLKVSMAQASRQL